MDHKAQGKILRAWREHEGVKRGKKLTLMTLAGEVAELAEKKGYPPNSRKIPGSHASLTRWENGAPQSIDGLQILAEIYGVGITRIMQMPPGPPSPEGDGEDAAVAAFREFLAQRRA